MVNINGFSEIEIGATSHCCERELEFANRIVSEMAGIDDVKTLFWDLLESLVWEFGFAGGGIYLLDKTTGMGELRYASGLPLDYVSKIRTIDPAKSPFADAFAGKAMLVSSAADVETPDGGWNDYFKFGEVLAVPLKHDGTVFGTVNLLKDKKPFLDVETSMVKVVCHSLEIALDRLDGKKKLEETYKNFDVLFESVNEMVFVTKPDGSILKANSNVEKVLGCERNQLGDRNILEIYLPEEHKKVAGIMNEIQEEGAVIKHISQMRSRHNELVEVESIVSPGFWDGKDALITISSGNCESTENQDNRYLFDHDHLTDVYNRVWLEDRLYELCENGVFPSSIVLMDINGFKTANETFGQKKGDKVLRLFAKKIKDESGDMFFLARWGGDEFALLMEGLDETAAMAVAEKIQQNAKIVLEGAVELDLSFGVAEIKWGRSPVEKAIAKAEEMMFRQKLFTEMSIQNGIIGSMQRTIKERNLETVEHTERMAVIAKNFASYLNLSKKEAYNLILLVTLHDIGKIGIPDEVLLKAGPLDEREWEYMKMHTTIGCRIAESTKTLRRMGKYILSHHEKWDGTGYPDGLVGEEIPAICRIMAMIDAYDVMTNERPYKESISEMDALLEIKRCSGTQFDPELAEKFIDFMTDKYHENTNNNNAEFFLNNL